MSEKNINSKENILGKKLEEKKRSKKKQQKKKLREWDSNQRCKIRSVPAGTCYSVHKTGTKRHRFCPDFNSGGSGNSGQIPAGMPRFRSGRSVPVSEKKTTP